MYASVTNTTIERMVNKVESLVYQPSWIHFTNNCNEAINLKKVADAKPVDLSSAFQSIQINIVFFSHYFFNRVQGSIELEAGDWIIMARTKNTEGWSDDRFSQEIQIKIPKGKRSFFWRTDINFN
jgi:hypothetical protein